MSSVASHMHYEVSGSSLSKQTVCFIHGLCCDLTDWEHQRTHFQDRYRVIGCDLKGHGCSAAPVERVSIERWAVDIAELLDSLNVKNGVLVGHSMGCRVALAAALRRPERVDAVALVDGSRFAGVNGPSTYDDALASIEAAGGWPVLVRHLFSQMFTKKAPASLRQRVMDRALAIPEAVGRAAFASMVAWDVQQLDSTLRSFVRPLTVIQSTYVNEERQRISVGKGESTPWLDHVRQRYSSAVIEIVPASGHFPQIESASIVNAHLQRVLDQVC
jgi:pimeloyl-ACP methyl ester carboxylesterase